MKEELTREVVEAMAKCSKTSECNRCGAYEFCKGKGWPFRFENLATALLEEMDKPKVWDGAPEDALQARITWLTKNDVCIGPKTYTRELPKTRARIMAEEIAAAQISNKKDLVDIIEQTIKTHIAELKEGE